MVLVFRDVTQERVAARALEKSEKRYRRFIELAPFGVLVHAAGRFIYMNPKALEIIGASSPIDVLGKPVLNFLHPDCHQAVRERMRHVKDQQLPVPPIEEKWIRLDGTVIYGEATAVPYEHEGMPAALVLVQDITARKAAEAQRDRFFSMPVDMLCIAGVDGYFKRLNPAFTTTLGWTAEELLASPFLDFVHPDDRVKTVAELERLTYGLPTLNFDNRYKCKDGSWKWLSWKCQPNPEEGLIYATARDVTSGKQIEEARERLTVELEQACCDAEQANRARWSFSATMDHEIRTPINGVIGHGELLDQSSLRGDQAMGGPIREFASRC